MYIDNYNFTEYPFDVIFYHLGVDKSKPLDERSEEKVVVYRSKCDYSNSNDNVSDNITLYMPLSSNSERLQVIVGEIAEVTVFGVKHSGRVLGLFPSQLGGVKIICTKI